MCCGSALWLPWHMSCVNQEKLWTISESLTVVSWICFHWHFNPKKCSQKYPQGSSEDSNGYKTMKTMRYEVILWNCIWPRRAYQWTVRLEDYSADFPAGRNWPFVVLYITEYWKELGIVLMISFFHVFLDSFICHTGWVFSLQAKKILLQTSVYFLFHLIVTAIVKRCRPHSSFTGALCSHLQQYRKSTK